MDYSQPLRRGLLPRKPADWRVINDLHGIAIGIEAVKAASTIAMGFRRRFNSHIIRHQKLMPRIDLFGRVDNETDVVEPLLRGFANAAVKTMKRQIVVAGRQVHIVGVRIPLDLHAEQFGIEVNRLIEFLDE